MKTLIRSLSLLTVVGTVTPACMVAPYDGQVVSDKDEPFFFMGFHRDPDVDIELTVQNPITGHFDPIASAQSHIEVETPIGDVVWQWYQPEIVIPEEYWQDGSCEGSFAKVRAREVDTGRSMFTFLQDWGACWEEMEYDIGRFIGRCRSPRSPEALMVTEDFEEFAPPLDPWMEQLERWVDSYKFTIRLRWLPSKYSRVQMRASVDGTTDVVECWFQECHGKWVCQIDDEESPFWTRFDNADELGSALYHRGTLEYRALDTEGCSNGPEWTPWTLPQRWYASGSIACTGGEPESEPPPPPEFTSWSIGCFCNTAYGVGLVELDACMADETGAGLMCGYFERDFEALYGVDMECEPLSYEDTGELGCIDGRWTVISVETELFEDGE